MAQLIFDVPRTARTVSAHPRHEGDVEEEEGEAIVVKKKTPPLFEVRGVVNVLISMPPWQVGRPSVLRMKEPLTYAGLLFSKDIVLELPVDIVRLATLLPPPEPYPYPAPDAYMEPSSYPTASPTPLLYTPMPTQYPSLRSLHFMLIS